MTINSLLDYLLKFSLFYNLQQTKREMLKEFRIDLRKEKASQDLITVRTYEVLSGVDRAIVDRFKDFYRGADNAVYLSHKLGYSRDGIKRRVKIIASQLKHNIQVRDESVQMG